MHVCYFFPCFCLHNITQSCVFAEKYDYTMYNRQKYNAIDFRYYLTAAAVLLMFCVCVPVYVYIYFFLNKKTLNANTLQMKIKRQFWFWLLYFVYSKGKFYFRSMHRGSLYCMRLSTSDMICTTIGKRNFCIFYFMSFI